MAPSCRFFFGFCFLVFATSVNVQETFVSFGVMGYHFDCTLIVHILTILQYSDVDSDVSPLLND